MILCFRLQSSPPQRLDSQSDLRCHMSMFQLPLFCESLTRLCLGYGDVVFFYCKHGQLQLLSEFRRRCQLKKNLHLPNEIISVCK